VIYLAKVMKNKIKLQGPERNIFTFAQISEEGFSE
jgi:hypothetical protein